MKETMVRRFALAILLAIQALGGGAVSLAHAREDGAVSQPAGFEASHNARCAILHDELRCALCQYASARVITQQAFTIATPARDVRFAPEQPAVLLAAVALLTAPARAPPPLLS
jgi:hypothetical protein